MKLLIVGSKGFIGSHAYKYFSSLRDTECWGCDVVVEYADKTYILVDAINSDFHDIFNKFQFDACINCSGAASVPDSFNHPQRDFNLNVYTVVKILDAIRRHSPHCKFINLSSAAVYGNPKQLPIKESDLCVPVSPYGFHKQFSESICFEYYTYFQLQTCSLRIFSAYGPGLRKQILWDIYQKTLSSDTIVLHGTGAETRDFIYVSDIVLAIGNVLLKGVFDGSIYNIANGEGVTIKHLAESLLQSLSFIGGLTFSGDNRIGDPINWQADISKIVSIGYKQQFILQKGIEKFVTWAKEKKLD